MEIYDKLIKPIKEVNYLRAENVDRYRSIIRYFFLEYEKINLWIHKEDVYNTLHSFEQFKDYTLEQCQLDLETLTSWGNLTASQDSTKARTIEDFRNKKYRYQLSEYTVEIERMTIRLENLEVEGASLESNLLERIYNELKKIDEILECDDSQVHGWLNLLMSDFIHLNQNYQDYIKTLNNAKAEELMKTTDFLLYKDKIVLYLRTFVIAIQETGNQIGFLLRKISDENLNFIFKKATQYEMSIPRLNADLNENDVYENYKNKWKSLYRWFSNDDQESELEHLYDITNEIIRKMTRYAQQIAESVNQGSNRKEQYLHIIDLFKMCNDINEAHQMSSYIFGVKDTLHFKNLNVRPSENIDVEVSKEKAQLIGLEPHTKLVRKKTVRKRANDYTLEKISNQLEIEARFERQMKIINDLIVDGIIDFSKLPKIDSNTRKTLLTWLSKALAQENNQYKTDDGRKYYIDRKNENIQCYIDCDDGHFYMPSFKIIFMEELNG